MTGKHRSRVDLLLRLCYSLRIPVRKLLEEDTTPNIASGLSRKRRLGKNQRRRPEILRVLQQALVEEPPPMLAEVARRLDHDRAESLSRMAPELCKRIVVRHQNAVLRLPRKGKPRICGKRFVVAWFDAWEITDGGPDPCFTSGISVAMAHQTWILHLGMGTANLVMAPN